MRLYNTTGLTLSLILGTIHRKNYPKNIHPIARWLNFRIFATLRARAANSIWASCKEALHPGVNKKIDTSMAKTSTEFSFAPMLLPCTAPNFSVTGLDPTAATWASFLTTGPKKMPSVTIRWIGNEFSLRNECCNEHLTNSDFWNQVDDAESVLCCIDGPCATNGPRLLPDRTAWDSKGEQGTRGAELALMRQGVHLFWTTQSTVMRWDGPSRWIARSLVLFAEAGERKAIETHPYGAFTFIWRLFGNTNVLPKKKTRPGRQARLAMLKSFIPDFHESCVPNDDAVDAAVAALVAGLHQLGLTTPFGTPDDGGQIWMPDIEKLRLWR